MVATYTDNLRVTKQGTNDNPNTWGDIVNSQVIELLEEAIAGVIEIDVTGTSDIDIATSAINGASDEARHAVLKLTGVLGADIDLIVPSVEKVYAVDCQFTGGTVRIIPSGAGSGLDFVNGDQAFFYTEGVNIVQLSAEVDPNLFLAVANNLSDLNDVPTARTNLGLGGLAVLEISDVLEVVYPVGSTYINTTDDTNPGTLFGVGTWVRTGQGRVLIGEGEGTDINAVAETFDIGTTGGSVNRIS